MTNEEKYIGMIETLWGLNEACCFTPIELSLFTYLLNVWYKKGCPDSFEFGDERIFVNINVSRNAMKKAREHLVELGVIDYIQGGCGRGSKSEYNFTCHLMTPNVTPKGNTCHLMTPNVTPKGTLAKEKNQKKNNTIPVNNNNDDFSPPTDVVGPQKSSSKPKKEPTLISKARYVFEAFFRDSFDAEYYWTAKDAKNMKDLLKKISFARASKKMSIDDDSLVEGMKALLDSIGNNFVLENFTVPIINSQYNAIVAQARASKKKSNGSNWSSNQSGTEQRMREGADIVARLLAEDDAKQKVRKS